MHLLHHISMPKAGGLYTWNFSQRFASLGRWKTLLLLILYFYPAQIFGQDLTTIIPQSVLNDYAVAVGPVTGSEKFFVPLYRPVLGISPNAHLVPQTRCLFMEVRWTWNVEVPRFKMKTSGVSFSAILAARAGKSTYFRPIEIPVTVQFNATSSTLELILTDTNVPVFLTVAGRTMQVGTVNVSPYYGTSLFVPQASFSLGGRSITGNIRNVNVLLRDGSIEITNNLEFQ